MPVWDVANMLIAEYGRGTLSKFSGNEKLHEAMLLSLDITKARFRLGWKPSLNLNECIRLTAEWYKSYTSCDTYELCVKQIKEYVDKGRL